MKYIYVTLAFLIALLSKAQTPVIDITESRFDQPEGYYMKDVNNLLNPFEGNYIYTNGTTSFKIQLVKKVQQYNGSYYEDLIIGEYRYVENNLEKINTLNQIGIVYNDQRDHSIGNNQIVNNNFRRWKCPTCTANEKRFTASIIDRISNKHAFITMRRTQENGQEVMQVKIGKVNNGIIVVGQPAPLDFSLPVGEFTMIKE